MKKPLKIVVLAKQVPDTRNVGKDAMTPEGTVNRAALPAIFNPEDLNALEAALRLKDAVEGSTVHILTMGPQRAADIIRDAMFRGADGGYLLSDRKFAGSDTLATSYALSCALRRIAPDLIVAGRQAIDGDTAQVGPQVAEKLGLPQVTYAEEVLKIREGSLVVKRRLEHGVETVECPLPAVVTVNASAAECRPRNAKRVMKYKYALAGSEIAAAAGSPAAERAAATPYLQIVEWAAADVDPDETQLGLQGSPTKVKKIENVVFAAKEAKRLTAADAEIESLMVELIASHTLGSSALEMNNVFVYIEMEGGRIADVSLELLTKGRELAAALGVKTEAVALGESLDGIEKELARYGADTVWVADDKIFNPFRTLPHTAVMCGLIEQEKPQIALFGATPVGRDFAPRVSSALHSGLTADCTQLEIGDHRDAKTGREYKDLLYQIRPAFGGNIIATIVNPDHRPQMATVREGVMRKEYAAVPAAGEVKRIDWQRFVKDTDLAVRIIDRQIEERRIDIKGAPIIVAGGYGMGSKENFRLVHELADVLGAEVGASRAAVDAGFTEHARQVGQTGVTVRPKLYIACGISGQIQHTAGMDQSSMIISINTDPDAPIARIADYAITGDVNEVIPKMIKYYKQNSK